jgi:hypothetical protein
MAEPNGIGELSQAPINSHAASQCREPVWRKVVQFAVKPVIDYDLKNPE